MKEFLETISTFLNAALEKISFTILTAGIALGCGII